MQINIAFEATAAAPKKAKTGITPAHMEKAKKQKKALDIRYDKLWDKIQDLEKKQSVNKTAARKAQISKLKATRKDVSKRLDGIMKIIRLGTKQRQAADRKADPKRAAITEALEKAEELVRQKKATQGSGGASTLRPILAAKKKVDALKERLAKYDAKKKA